MTFVVDNSVTMAWCFGNEATEFTRSALRSLQTTSAVVPAIWPLEVANVLALAERRGRITRAEAYRFVSVLGSLPIVVDDGALHDALGRILTLARDYGLSSYDAAYLELAMRTGLPLASNDERLVAAAQRAGVALLSSTP